MAPSAVDTTQATDVPAVTKTVPVSKAPRQTKLNDGSDPNSVRPVRETGHKEPLTLSGALDQFPSFDVTPVIGREFGPEVDLAAWLRAPNADDLLRDLAITVSQRGVVFFRKQDNITDELQKELVQRLGELSGKPATSKLHIHPINNAGRGERSGSSNNSNDEPKDAAAEKRDHDDEISVISSVQAKKLFLERFEAGFSSRRQSGRNQWHSDITFEPVPSDYALLRLTKLPKTGGDTLWASGYELYDRISPTLRQFLDTLTAYYAQPGFEESAARNGFELYAEPRGAPENVGTVLEAIHPVVRTNPVTGWKSVFAVGHHVKRIHGLSDAESQHFLEWFNQLVVDNHDLQVRLRWQDVNDLAIWDNRSVYHAATPDYIYEEGLGERSGSRAVSLGEKPYFDPQSTSRREAQRAQK
ncbi:hypothetical protein SCUCBS95973_007147 [Sporothrix curviconia]|uniref:TauD/TfdA-like domain-containing protein n=1 Tax=Sporothrix curviconia TaxID=1260050 RepID=A0ABP0CB10_9PEZI